MTTGQEIQLIEAQIEKIKTIAEELKAEIKHWDKKIKESL